MTILKQLKQKRQYNIISPYLSNRTLPLHHTALRSTVLMDTRNDNREKGHLNIRMRSWAGDHRVVQRKEVIFRKMCFWVPISLIPPAPSMPSQPHWVDRVYLKQTIPNVKIRFKANYFDLDLEANGQPMQSP